MIAKHDKQVVLFFRDHIQPLLTELYVTDRAKYEKVAKEHGETYEKFAATGLATLFVNVLKSPENEAVEIFLAQLL